MKVRGNNDTTYRAIENNTIPSVNPQEKDIMLVSTAQTDTQYYINNSGISASSDGVKLMVDHSLDDALLSAYINRTSNSEGKYSYQFRYLDLVDTSNGNTYVTMGAGQKMNLYWPVPSDAKSNSEFHIIHFKGIDRDSDADVNELLTTRIPEELTCETVTIGGQKFVKFAVDSFSPFALLYEKDTSTPTQPSGGGGIGGGEDPYGNLTVSKTVTGKAGDTEQKFTFTVTLDRSISGTYGDMTFNKGTAVITLKHGESSTATKLPADIRYTVTESDNEGYTVTANGDTGVIRDGKTAVAAFTNTKDSEAPNQPGTPDTPVTPNQPSTPDVPSNPGTPDRAPKTGDTMNLALWLSLMGLSLAGLFGSLIVVKKNSYRGKRMK